ncbi:hypothetical protein CRENBAI_021565 [Crenichthys baileyi]|uniref:SAM domain-containing protein n=1 Tax=Crenichthys baileyi TaxID=28760 RepID=A0AAV9QZG2_9TELE
MSVELRMSNCAAQPVYPPKMDDPNISHSLTRNTAIEVASTVKALYNETESLLLGRVSLQLDPPEEEQLSSALQSLDVELGKLGEIPWLYHILQPNDEEDQSLGYGKRNSRSSVFRIVPKFKKEKAAKKMSPQSVERWGTEEVGVWLEQMSLGEYRDTFIRHDIRGSELLHLERRDLKAKVEEVLRNPTELLCTSLQT